MFLAIMTVVPIIWPKTLFGNRGRLIVYGMIGFIVVFGFLMVLLPAEVIPDFYGSTGWVNLSFLLDLSPLMRSDFSECRGYPPTV